MAKYDEASSQSGEQKTMAEEFAAMTPAGDAMNPPASPLEIELHVPMLVELRAQERPDALAISDGETRLTYRELLERSNAVAHRLKELELKRGNIVGIYSERSAAMIVSALGIMRAGGAYLPLACSNPAARIAFQLQDAGAKLLIIGEGPVAEEVVAKAGHVLRCVGDGKLHGKVENKAFSAELSSDDLAYVIYTSGSTGQPKGVEITHAGLMKLVSWHNRAFNVTPSERASFVAGVGFDAAVWELWPYLSAGASVHVAHDSTVKEPEALKDWFVSQQITIGFTPTPLTEHLMELEWPAETSLRIMLTGGDLLHRYPHPRANLPFQLVNNYGPTECTVVSTSGALPVADGADQLPPIGWPVTHAKVYILDESRKPVAAGEEGEIWIGGGALARGYRNRPELTAEKFIPNPFDPALGARLYRTGDRGRFLADGQIAFAGRVDEQIKFLGYRIEPGEIEARLNEHADIRESAVVARELSSGQKLLIAYFVARSKPAPRPDEIQQFLRMRLPEHMVASRFVELEELPLTPNGKIDRKALLALGTGEDSAASATKISPRDATETALQKIWQETLCVERIGVQEDFFDLGGDSIQAARLIARAQKEFGVKLPLSAVLEARSIEDLARVIREQKGTFRWSSLVVVQAKGSRSPLFCVHSHTGDVLYCEYISRGAGIDQPIYGLQSRISDGKAVHFTIEEMAKDYVEELRRVQPAGPYNLFGFCFGGMVAFEMARQLEAAGEQIAFLGIYNSPAPGTLKGWPLGQFSYLRRRSEDEWKKLRMLTGTEQWKRARVIVRNIGLMISRTVLVDGWRAVARLRGRSEANVLGKWMLNLEEINIAAGKSFYPASGFSGPITLFLSQEVANVYPVAPETGWKRLAGQGVRLIEVPLDERGWRGTPFVEGVGGRLRELLTAPGIQ